MPIYRLSRTIGLPRGVKAFLDLRIGATRGDAPMALAGDGRHRKLKTFRREVKEQRQLLKAQDREISRLKKLISASKASSGAAARYAEGTERGALPDFLIIGGMKCGTTFLYWSLSQHPRVRPASAKEVHYFDANFDKDDSWYRSQFPPKRDETTLTGESSPYYLFHPLAARRAAQTVPDAKLIALLRNPVDRAYSDYQQQVMLGVETLSFQDALKAEEERTAGEREKMLADELYVGRNYRRYSYRSRGVYVDQIREWHRHFDPEQLLVLKSEDLYEDPVANLKIVHRFLGLPEHDPAGVLSTRGRGHTDYPPMDPAVYRQLEEFFEPHNQRLYDYLDVDFGW